jgi:hypothetical protein
LLRPGNRNKKKAGRPRMNDKKAMNAISIFYVLAVSGKPYHAVLVLPVQCMTDFRSRERLVMYSNVCGLIVC